QRNKLRKSFSSACRVLRGPGDILMDFIKRTIELAATNVEQGGRPFACVIVKDGKVLSEAVNRVAQTHDPTAHAEINAIREATRIMGSEHLTGCTFYIGASLSDVSGRDVLLQPRQGCVPHDAGRLFSLLQRRSKVLHGCELLR